MDHTGRSKSQYVGCMDCLSIQTLEELLVHGCLGSPTMENFCTNHECSDGIKDGDETGVDCGGDCVGCPDGEECRSDLDCKSYACVRGSCMRPRLSEKWTWDQVE